MNGIGTHIGVLVPSVSSAGGVQGGSAWGTALIAMFFFVVVAVIGTIMAGPKDRSWLAIAVMVAYVVKLLGSTARYLVLELVYGGKGDASGYHGAGLALSETWRSFQFPSTVRRVGTDMVDAITGLLYVPYQPAKLGGFFIFASLAFFGQLLLYAAFRHSFPARHLKWYAALIFLWPTIVYWPSSIGKESLMMLWIGIASYGAARLLAGYNPAWVLLVAIGLAGGGLIRPHMSLLLAAGLVAALAFARAPAVGGAQIRRLGLLGTAAAALVVVALSTAQNLGFDVAAAVSVDAAGEELGEVLGGVEDQTNTGGSAVTGGSVKSPLDLPEAILRVIFRPLPNEAANAQLLVASLEGTLLLAVFLWRLPWMVRNLMRVRRYPYAVYSLVYTGGFILAFSSILNLGILSRQRSQVMPFFLALLVVLGRKHVEEPAVTEPGPEPSTLPRQPEMAGR